MMPFIADDIEASTRQSHQGKAILDERLTFWLAFPVVTFDGQAIAVLRKMSVIDIHIGNAGQRNEKSAPDGSNLVLHTAFLIAGMRIAKRKLKSVVGAEGVEEPCGSNAVACLAADASGIVEDETFWNSTDILEDALEPFTDTFGILAQSHLGKPLIRERKVDDQEA